MLSHKTIKIFSSLGLILGLSFFSLPLSPQADVSEYEKKLNELSEQIRETRVKIRQEEKHKDSITAQLGKIGLQKELVRKEISFYNTRLDKTNAELSDLNKRIPLLESRLEKKEDNIKKILVTLYKFGQFNYIEFMAQAENIGTLIAENKHLTVLAQHQEKVLTEYLETMRELETAREDLKEKKANITSLLAESQQKREELNIHEKRNNDLVQKISQNREAHLQTLEELNERAVQLQNLIKKLLDEGKPLSFPLVPLYEKKGSLPWPISGKISTSFGEKRHPRFKTLTKSNGIEITPSKEVIVKSIHPGAVAFCDYFQGYGKLIIINHGLGYYSLYGFCSDWYVKKGDPVQAGQPIALVGDIGSLSGTALYFEIREKRTALNPLQWLKKR